MSEQCPVCGKPLEGETTITSEGEAHQECAGFDRNVDVLPDGGTARKYDREAEDAVKKLARDFEYNCDPEHAELARDLANVLEALQHVLVHDLSDANVQNALRTVVRRHINLRETEAVRPSEDWFDDDESSTDTEQSGDSA